MKYRFYFSDRPPQNFQGDQDRIDWIVNQLNPTRIERIDKGEQNPFPEFGDLPKVFIGDVEISPRSLRGKLKAQKELLNFRE